MMVAIMGKWSGCVHSEHSCWDVEGISGLVVMVGQFEVGSKRGGRNHGWQGLVSIGSAKKKKSNMKGQGPISYRTKVAV